MKALSSNYQSREDVENVAKLEGMLNSIVQMCMSREQDAHTLIRGACCTMPPYDPDFTVVA